MPLNVSEFQQQLQGQGARASLFEVQLAFPGTVAGRGNAELKSRFMVRATSLPGSSVSIMPVFYQGREVKLAGDRTFDTWGTTVINDEDFAIRTSIEDWMQQINAHEGNIRSLTQYKTPEMTVSQLNKQGQAIRTYTFVNVWPTDLAPIDLDWGNQNVIEEFTCTWSYDYWTVGANGAQAGLTVNASINL